MLISSAPIVIPVNTANVPTEAVATEAAQRPKIPQPSSAAEGSSSKNATDFAEQSKANLPGSYQTEQERLVQEEKSSQQQSSKEDASQGSEQRAEEELELAELQQVQKLQSRDREVRAHEQAHASVGGNLAGAPNLNFTTGPDGKRYAVSGDVSIDISKVSNDPAATIRKLEQVQRAALAPANPSSQDRKVAAQAAASETQARSDLNVQRLEESKQQEAAKQSRIQESDGEASLSSSTNPDIVNLKEPNSSQTQSLSSSGPSAEINPVSARRQAAQLNQRIAGSGALDLSSHQESRSFRA